MCDKQPGGADRREGNFPQDVQAVCMAGPLGSSWSARRSSCSDLSWGSDRKYLCRRAELISSENRRIYKKEMKFFFIFRGCLSSKAALGFFPEQSHLQMD